jgi:predicted glycoside hydrolase/deacetylase ChbG (UPF0249 family)
MSQSPKNHNARLLGYPDDARMLIINADDFGMCHAINEAILRSIKEGIVQSTSLMPVCPWALNGIQILKENPDIPFAVHLTTISEAHNYRWSPLSPKEKVPSLVDENGYCPAYAQMMAFMANVNLDELEMEFRAQIEFVLKAGLKPTHLDWHCLKGEHLEPIFNLMFRLAQEYGLALRIPREPMTGQVQSKGLPANDHPLLDSYDLPIEGKLAHYAWMLRDLPSGLSEWAVHPGYGTSELQAIEPKSWQVRQSDFEFVISPEAREIIRQEGIILLNYKPLQLLWQNQAEKSSAVS